MTGIDHTSRNPWQWGWAALVLMLTVLLTGCFEDPEEERIEKLNALAEAVRGTLFLASIIFVLGTIFGPDITEWARAKLANHFHLTREQQLGIANAAFWIGFSVILLSTFIIEPLRLARLAVWVLLAGSLYPFLGEVLPGIVNENANLRKSGVAKIKALFFLIFVYYILLTLLSPKGFGALRIDPE